MSIRVNPISTLCAGKKFLKIRARVIRMWDVCPVNDQLNPYAVHIVLIDAEGNKIEASARKEYITKFRSELREGSVYRIFNFIVLDNSGNYMATSHESKLLFNDKTQVILEETPSIPLNGFSFKNSEEILATGGESDSLIDVIGLVTNVSGEKKYMKAGKVTRMVELELRDDKGKVNCSLFGHFVDVVKQHIAADADRMPVVIIQFAKIKTFKGNVVIQNVMNATVLLWNPPVNEAAVFLDGLAIHGIESNMPFAGVDEDDDDLHVITIEEEFLTLFPRKDIKQLHQTDEDGIFVVLAEISGLLEGEKWWYSACTCHRAVKVEDGVFHCNGCGKYALTVNPRFRLKVDVDDGCESAVFVIFDTDCQQLTNNTCKELVSKDKAKYSHEYPIEIKRIIGRELLFKVEKSINHGSKFDGSFKVKKICADTAVVESFKDKSKVLTPNKMVTKNKFLNINDGSHDSLGDYSSHLSEDVPEFASLDDISPGDGSGASSSVQSDLTDASVQKPAKKMRLRSVKVEKE